jgi:hypothetical protein
MPAASLVCPVFKIVVRFLGCGASGLFAAQGVWLLAHPDMDFDFWEGCHWFGQGMLGLIVGAIGCFLEARGGMKSVTRYMKWYMMNRLGLGIFYFWMGCYVMGGMGVLHTGKEWKYVAHATGIISWVVAAGDILVSCTTESTDEEDDGLVDSATPPAKEQAPSKFGKSRSKPRGLGSDGNAADVGGTGGSPFDIGSAEDPPDPPSPIESPTNGAQPSGGWNTFASKPFGS